jgi:hypothetical protein
MRIYDKPLIDIMEFDEHDIEAAVSNAMYADRLIQMYTFGDEELGENGVGVNSSVSIKLQEIKVNE